MGKLILIWEIPLAILSFVFYKITKFLIGNLFTIYLVLNKSKASMWRFISRKMLDSPLILPVLMTKGPRWNTHAIIGTLGPFKVEQEVSLNIATANSSARSWIAVIYSFPGYKTITSLESSKISTNNDWYSIKLPTGKYSFGLRYYNRLNKITLPAIKIDDNILTDSQEVPVNNNDFYHDLIKAKSWFYSSLHYYIFTILKLRNFLPESFVRKEFLPVGAPDTFFAYNYLGKRQSLKLDFAQEIIDNCNIYFNLYDRSSLPLSWCEISTTEHNIAAPETNSYYLLRIRPQPGLSFDTSKIQFQIVTENDLSQQALLKNN
ncbi:hypothetical protein Xen7305DRAFT_00013100 [Xenococcus sp. PCC 7305]|uniref:DUF6208 family protein n=1 Tax=Xenococcus sp. PCC 7305 TaxID=102125 RepID=UPI0002AC39E6|nr:DUF6208 family protein [Xenococcus sp. PCC 7305]ELS01606.1 hypothetical protein Xen7305DRAFT_00013100 [Xenococcus sp. PCC 7305]